MARSTRATHGRSLTTARTILLAVVHGSSGDPRFKRNAERGEGVLIEDGSTFHFAPMLGQDGNGSIDREPQHYIWFCD